MFVQETGRPKSVLCIWNQGDGRASEILKPARDSAAPIRSGKFGAPASGSACQAQMEKTGVAQAALPCVKRLRNSDTNLLRPRSVVPCPTNIFSHPPMEVKYKKKAHGELSPQNLSWREGICSPKPGTGVRRPGASQLSPAASGGPRRRFGGTCKRFRRRRACFVFLTKIGLPSLVGFEQKQRKPPLLFEKHSFGDAGSPSSCQ